MMDPPPDLLIAGMAYLHPHQTPLTLICIVKSQIFSGVVSKNKKRGVCVWVLGFVSSKRCGASSHELGDSVLRGKRVTPSYLSLSLCVCVCPPVEYLRYHHPDAWFQRYWTGYPTAQIPFQPCPPQPWFPLPCRHPLSQRQPTCFHHQTLSWCDQR